MRTLLVLALCLSSAFALTDVMGSTTAGNGSPATSVLAPYFTNLDWQTLTPMPTARFGAAVASAGGMLFAVGGYGSSRLTLNEAYEPVGDTWSTRTPMANMRNGCCGATADSWIFVVGGYNGSTRLNIVEGYSVTADSWYTLPNMSLQRTVPAAVGLNGKLYVFGGFDSANYHRTVERYDIASNTWDTVAPMPTGRSGLAAAVLNGKIYTVGGWTGAEPTHTELEMYDPDSNAWTSLAPMPTGRMYLAAAAFGGCFFAIGGQLSFSGGYASLVECYDPQTGAWTTSTSMPVGRSSIGAATIDDKAYVLGGYNGSALARNDRAEILTGTSEAPSGIEAARLCSSPNPFNTTTTIRWSAPSATPAAISIHDASGRLIRTLRTGSGNSSVAWDRTDAAGRTVRPGVYFCSAQLGTTSLKTRLVVAP